MYAARPRALGTKPPIPTVGIGLIGPSAATTDAGMTVSTACSAGGSKANSALAAVTSVCNWDCLLCRSARMAAAASTATLASAVDFADAAAIAWASLSRRRKTRICSDIWLAIVRWMARLSIRVCGDAAVRIAFTSSARPPM